MSIESLRPDVQIDVPSDSRSLRKRRGAHESPDLYRVNSEVNNLKPFACLALPHNTFLKTSQKQNIFGDQLVTSFSFSWEEKPFSHALACVMESRRETTTDNPS
jgi:hypothetical protein